MRVRERRTHYLISQTHVFYTTMTELFLFFFYPTEKRMHKLSVSRHEGSDTWGRSLVTGTANTSLLITVITAAERWMFLVLTVCIELHHMLDA